MVFPLPPALSQLADAFCDKDAGSEVSGAVTGGGGQQPSSSSEDERHWSNVMYDRKVGKELTAEKGSHILICNHSRRNAWITAIIPVCHQVFSSQ